MNVKLLQASIFLFLLIVLLGALTPLALALSGAVWAKQFAIDAHDILHPYKTIMHAIFSLCLIVCGLTLYKPYDIMKNISEESRTLVLWGCLALAMAINLVITIYA